MKSVRMIALLAPLAVVAPAAWSQNAPTPATPERTVEQYLCKDVMRESGTNRDAEGTAVTTPARNRGVMKGG